MNSYVFIYERLTGELKVEEFGPGREYDAMMRRFELEGEVAPGVEVVVFHADNVDEIRATHGRYFMTVQELVNRFEAAL